MNEEIPGVIRITYDLTESEEFDFFGDEEIEWVDDDFDEDGNFVEGIGRKK